MTHELGPIVVGADSSVAARRAISWALAEAATHGHNVRLVRSYEPAITSVGLGYGGVIPEGVVADLREFEQGELETIVASAAAETPTVSVTGRLVVGNAAMSLLTQDDASMIVVGSRGRGGFRGLLLGSVSQQVATHARTPIVVVRGPSDRDRSHVVVVAVDGSPASRDAVQFAFDFASRHAMALRAVHAWEVPFFDGPGVTVPVTLALDQVKDEEIRLTAEAIAGWSQKYPDVAVSQQAIHGSAERVVIDATSDADLIVVGSRGRGGFTGLLLGSVSQALLHHSDCPVAVIRPSDGS